MASGHLENELEKGMVSPSTDNGTFLERSTTTMGTTATLIERYTIRVGFRCKRDAFLRLLSSLHLPWASKNDPLSSTPGRMAPTVVHKLEDSPAGFPRMAHFLASDDNFMVYRRFGLVFSRLLLRKQDELRRMESELKGMDKTDEGIEEGRYLRSHSEDDNRGSIPPMWQESRGELMDRMEKKALEYAGLLLKAQQVKSLNPPSTRDYRSVLHVMENGGGQLFEEESEFIYDKDDLVTVRPGREYAWLDSAIESVLRSTRCSLTEYFFCTEETKAKTDNSCIHYWDRKRISTCATMIITSIILFLLVLPIWILYKFSVAPTKTSSPDSIGIILVFTLVFTAVLSAFTRAKRHEILAAAAGYCAVLVVFLGNVSNRSSNNNL